MPNALIRIASCRFRGRRIFTAGRARRHLLTSSGLSGVKMAAFGIKLFRLERPILGRVTARLLFGGSQLNSRFLASSLRSKTDQPPCFGSATLRNVMLVVRADEAHHRDVNHGLASQLAGMADPAAAAPPSWPCRRYSHGCLIGPVRHALVAGPYSVELTNEQAVGLDAVGSVEASGREELIHGRSEQYSDHNSNVANWTLG